MHEIIVNLHMHTRYSDGRGLHADLVRAAQKAQVDAIIATDHNVWVRGVEGYHGEGNNRVLLLVGEEVHDQARDPQKNHLLVFGAERELATYADDPQRLIRAVNQAGGICFLAHPIDPEAPNFAEEDLSWVSWDVSGYTGIELWNAMTEFKSLLKSRLHAIFYAFNPSQVAHGPRADTVQKWDELLAQGKNVVAIGGSDAHALVGRMGILSKVLFPYEFHFRAVNTHVFIPNPLSGDAVSDRRAIYEAMAKGHAFIGYDLPAPTRGFRFSAHCANSVAWMGDSISAKEAATLQVKLPRAAEFHLLKDGERIRSVMKRDALVYKVTERGVYRVEAYIQYRGKRRAWIFSNPIYVK